MPAILVGAIKSYMQGYRNKSTLLPGEAADDKKRRLYRWKFIIGLFGPFTLLALDNTVIASAFPYIATDFNEIRQLNWITSSFNLTSAAFLPLWAQLNDAFGRYFSVQLAIVIMIVGSAVCTGAPTTAFGVLLLGRSLQGIAAAGLTISTRTILADRVSLYDYALTWTISTLLSGIMFAIGPVIGGHLTQASWRWCFAINIPTAVVAILLIKFLLHGDLLGPQPLQTHEGQDASTARHGIVLKRLYTIDYGGHILFLVGLGLISLALTWGGGTFSWNSIAVIAPLTIGGALSTFWLFYEYSMSPGYIMSRFFPNQKPMMPWKLLSNRDVGLLFYVNFTIGIAQLAITYFMVLYFALVNGWSSSKAGNALLYYMPGLAVGTYMALFSSNVWPRQTLPALLIGSITSAVGITILAWAVHIENASLTYGMMALVGHGVMIRMNPGSLHALAYFPTMTAHIACLISFAMPLGGLVGLTIMSTVFTNKSGVDQKDPKSGITWAFISIIPFMWLSVALTMILGNVWILNDGGHEVVNGVYLLSFVTRKKLPRERISGREGVDHLAPMDSREDGENISEAEYTQPITTIIHQDRTKDIEDAIATGT